MTHEAKTDRIAWLGSTNPQNGVNTTKVTVEKCKDCGRIDVGRLNEQRSCAWCCYDDLRSAAFATKKPTVKHSWPRENWPVLVIVALMTIVLVGGVWEAVR